jgi:hypothetical protein
MDCKFPVGILEDPAVGMLSDHEFRVLIELHALLQHRGEANMTRLAAAWIIRKDYHRFIDTLASLDEVGFLDVDGDRIMLEDI